MNLGLVLNHHYTIKDLSGIEVKLNIFHLTVDGSNFCDVSFYPRLPQADETQLPANMPGVVLAAEPFIPDGPKFECHSRAYDEMYSDFARWLTQFTDDDVASLEALCFNRADKILRPYSALMRAPAMNNTNVGHVLARRAHELTKNEVKKAYSMNSGWGERSSPA